MPGFPSERHQNLLHHPRLSLHTGAFCNPHTRRHHESMLRILSLFMSISLCTLCLSVCVYMLSPHVLCVCTCMCLSCVCTCMWLSCVCTLVPFLLACLTGSDTSVAFPGESGPVPNCQEINATDSALLPPPPLNSPLSLCLSLFPPPLLSLSLSVSPLFFFLPLSCSEHLLKMEWVCAAYLKWSWMDLNGWWYLVSPQGAAMSP